LNYARDNFLIGFNTKRQKICEYMTKLAYNLEVDKVKEELRKANNDLEKKFMKEYLVSYNLKQITFLHHFLSNGISSISCFELGKTENECSNCFLRKSFSFPNANIKFRLTRSFLKCRITGELINHKNLPLCLPNGQIYGTNALKKMHELQGYITCPESKKIFLLQDCKKVFIL
jgi:hypothetical protein